MSACTWCRGTGQTEPTALDRLDQAETGCMDLQCLACDGTGQTPPPRPVNWCAKCRIRLTYADDPDELCCACAGTGLTRADGEPL